MVPDLSTIDAKALPSAPAALAGGHVPSLEGYVFAEQLGVGGSGEVWKAVDSTGQARAVKLIFGSSDQRRAAQELKSLSRVMSLPHPSLLTIHDVTDVDGRVIIISDLAEKSLQDRFQECQAAGMRGIPRDELMTYLFDTAEALDFLEREHHFQHLDIKPENLLLVGGRIKVADFGLLKDMAEANTSLINGLTPKYASPEVFDGRPSRTSDQYSLAIVFQEMATGLSPFSGRTAAQLASQHLHSTPDLTPLAPLERFAVGKALSKDPATRFRTCREFVERLVPRSRTTLLTCTSPASDENQIVAEKACTDTAGAHDSRTAEVVPPQLVRLPPIQLDSTVKQFRPTIFVGIGHLGGKVLRAVKKLLQERFGMEKQFPAFQFLAIDTDPEALQDVLGKEKAGGLSTAETLLLPIETTWKYRTSQVSQIDSISRRWLFNVPRSQKTEGLRALGRVAFLDHAERVKSRFRGAILAATDAEGITTTATATELPLANCDPRVFMIASPGGGTGSGMLIDAAYAMRQMLIETGFADDQVFGILPFASREHRGGPYLAPANTLACLRELDYYSLSGEYPGEIACGLAGFREELPTLAHTYFIDVGEQLGDPELSAGTAKVATFLYLNAASPAAPFFDAARSGNPPGTDREWSLRSFALESLAADSLDVSEGMVDRVCRAAIDQWRDSSPVAQAAARSDKPPVPGDRQADEAYWNRLATDHVAQVGLESRTLFKAATQFIERRGQISTAKMINEIVAEALGPAARLRSGGASPLGSVLQKLHRVTGLQWDEETDRIATTDDSLRAAVLKSAECHGQQLGSTLQRIILSAIDRSDCRLSGAQQILAGIVGRIKTLAAETLAQLKQIRNNREQLFRELNGAPSADSEAGLPGPTAVVDDLRRYTYLLFQETTLESVLKTISAAEICVGQSSEQLRDLSNELNRLADEFSTDVSADSEANDRGLLESPVIMGADTKDEVERSFFQGQSPLGEILSRRGRLRASLASALRDAAKRVVQRNRRRSMLARLYNAQAETYESDIDRMLGEKLVSLEQASGRLGGAFRLFLHLPDEALAARLSSRVAQMTGELPTQICDPQGEMLAIYEIEKVPLTIITNRLIRSKPDCESLASRLHTRTDVRFEP